MNDFFKDETYTLFCSRITDPDLDERIEMEKAYPTLGGLDDLDYIFQYGKKIQLPYINVDEIIYSRKNNNSNSHSLLDLNKINIYTNFTCKKIENKKENGEITSISIFFRRVDIKSIYLIAFAKHYHKIVEDIDCLCKKSEENLKL